MRACLVIVGMIVAVIAVLMVLGSPPGEDTHEWQEASGRIWSGVEPYYGPKRMHVGTVVGGNGDFVYGAKKRRQRWEAR